MRHASLALAAILLSAFFSAAAPSSSRAQAVIVVVGFSEQDVQAALDAAGDQGTVVVPAGRYAIEGTLRVRSNGLTLSGAGPDQTTFFRTADGTRTALVRSTGFAGVRVTGIRFEGASRAGSNGEEIGVLIEDSIDFRIDHSFFTHTGFAGVRTNGASRGVVDHCTFEDLYKPAVGTDGYGVAVYGSDVLEGVAFGSDLATFIEDSTFRLCRHAVASNKGARYVFRFNQVSENTVAHAVDAHGAEFGSTVGTEWIDVHDNVIDRAIYRGYAVRIRGGAGLIWNNTFSGYNQGVELTQDTSQQTGEVDIWNNSIDPPASPMVRARGTMGTPTFVLAAPVDYTPYPYPHPLVVD